MKVRNKTYLYFIATTVVIIVVIHQYRLHRQEKAITEYNKAMATLHELSEDMTRTRKADEMTRLGFYMDSIETANPETVKRMLDILGEKLNDDDVNSRMVGEAYLKIGDESIPRLVPFAMRDALTPALDAIRILGKLGKNATPALVGIAKEHTDSRARTLAIRQLWEDPHYSGLERDDRALFDKLKNCSPEDFTGCLDYARVSGHVDSLQDLIKRNVRLCRKEKDCESLERICQAKLEGESCFHVAEHFRTVEIDLELFRQFARLGCQAGHALACERLGVE